MTREKINSDVDYLQSIADANTVAVINSKKWMVDIHTDLMTIEQFKSYLYINRDRVTKAGWTPIMYRGDDGYTCGVCYTSDHLRNVNDTATMIGEDLIWDLSANSLHPMSIFKDKGTSTLQSLRDKRLWLDKTDKLKLI